MKKTRFDHLPASRGGPLTVRHHAFDNEYVIENDHVNYVSLTRSQAIGLIAALDLIVGDHE